MPPVMPVERHRARLTILRRLEAKIIGVSEGVMLTCDEKKKRQLSWHCK